jgi:hypothetical protein
MVEEGRQRKLSKLSFEDVQAALAANKRLRLAVLRYLARDFAGEFERHVSVSIQEEPRKRRGSR